MDPMCCLMLAQLVLGEEDLKPVRPLTPPSRMERPIRPRLEGIPAPRRAPERESYYPLGPSFGRNCDGLSPCAQERRRDLFEGDRRR